MQYMLLIYRNEADVQRCSREELGQMTQAYRAYTDALMQAGVHRAGAALQPCSAATTVRIADDRTQVLNGPYADTKEQLGGYYLIDVPDLDAALSWAARCPGAGFGVMEVRPIREV